MSEHVIALDPGGRSGWASATMSEDRMVVTGGGVLRMDLMADWLAQAQGIGPAGGGTLWDSGINEWERIPVPRKPTFDVVVYESWKPRRDEQGRLDWIEGSDLLNAQHVGQVRWIALASGAKVVEQHPSDKPQALASMPEAIRDLDRFSNEQHDKDARMHLWLYFFREWFSARKDPEHTVVT